MLNTKKHNYICIRYLYIFPLHCVDLETSGDFASGDFHEWTDDEDDDIMNDEDEIEDDDEDEGDDDDDDREGYI